MTRTSAIRILSAAAAIGLLAQLLLIDNLLGFNAPLLVIGAILAAVAVRPVGARFDPIDAWMPVGAVVVSAGIAIRADPFLALLDAGTACLLMGASIAALGGIAITRRSVAGLVTLGLIVLGYAGVGVLRVAAATRRPAAEAGTPRRLPAWAAPVARGLLIVAPVLLVFVVLFSAADAVFERLTENLFNWKFDLGELPVRAAVAVLVAWAVGGLLAVAGGALVADDEDGQPGPAFQSLGAAAAAPSASNAVPLPRLGTIEATTILVAIDILFGLFVVLQLAYLFGGLDTLAASGPPYAQYARRGFFELVAVAVLAGGLLVVVNGVVARRTPALVGAGVGLCALSAVILASALLRLRIYQDAYGWTELRFYVLATIVWLAIGIGITVVLLLRDRMRWLIHGLTMAAVVVLVAVNLVGPSRLIADQNVDRLLNPALVPADGEPGLDVGYAVFLADDAVPALVRALPALGDRERKFLLEDLAARRSTLAGPEAGGWPSWNVGRERAREALANLPAR
jgi:hypothetical protein